MKMKIWPLYLILCFSIIATTMNAKASETFRLWRVDVAKNLIKFEENQFSKAISPQGILDFLFNKEKNLE